MGIRLQLQLLIVLFITTGIGLLGLQEWVHLTTERAVETEHVVDEIERTAFQITTLTAEIASKPAEVRPQQQWRAKFEQLEELLRDPRIQSKRAGAAIAQLRRVMGEMQAQISRMIEAAGSGPEAAYFQERLSRELQATLLVAQSIVSNASTVRNILTEGYLKELHEIRAITLYVTLAAVAILILAGSVMMIRMIGGLSLLQEGIEVFSQGKLSSRITMRSKDELGSIAKSLNSMAAKLSESMASRDRLEGMVKERTDALQKSRLAAISVMEDINIQRHQTEEAKEALEKANAELEGEIKIRKAKESELRRSEAMLRQAKAGAEEASRSKSIFLANMSHELRTPLNAILGFSQLMQMDPNISEESRINLQTINRSGSHLLTLINDVLDMSKIEAGKVELQNDSFNFDELVHEAIDMMLVRASSKGVELQLDSESVYPKFIHGDAAKIRQILINLLSNAIKFTEEGRIVVKFSSEAPDAKGYFRLNGSVSDTGIGIKAEDIDKVFAPFEQIVGKGEEKIDQKGTGLGLALCKQFIEMMDGHVEVQSEFGLGSTFSFTITVKEASAAEIPEQVHEARGVPVGLAEGVKAVKVLIAEDDTASGIILENVLRKAGLQTLAVQNGEQAVAQFRAWKPDLICMDRRMPVMDGLEAVRHIRQEPGGKDVVIIAVTAVAFSEERQQMLDAGCDDLVKKPYTFEEIFQVIERNLKIEFVYPEPGEGESQGETGVKALDKSKVSDALKALPAQLLDQVHRSALELDMDGMEEALAELDKVNPELAESLRAMHRQLDYSAILKLVQED
ncbi:Signal transduction histidine kinase [Mariprofundus ferrinatatus]|uniref:histidine kinase n=1 Tax=Mariprofundus ferrinatatus TaxID=1921087 RepID=A0A2K8LF30_9PROT|nr:ATP-binding protein [Mariprofundus ferrinatatus]ATX82876.1 Signal transduction histidine kinase [Mariprofundus ferrinatatus]